MQPKATSRSAIFLYRLTTYAANIQFRSASPSLFYPRIHSSSLRDPCPNIVIPRLGISRKRKRRSPMAQGRPVSQGLPNSALRLCTLLKLLPNAAMSGPSVHRPITAIASLCPPIRQYCPRWENPTELYHFEMLYL
jgi:hypothetical protein